jgi:hypothetical protein
MLPHTEPPTDYAEPPQHLSPQVALVGLLLLLLLLLLLCQLTLSNTTTTAMRPHMANLLPPMTLLRLGLPAPACAAAAACV